MKKFFLFFSGTVIVIIILSLCAHPVLKMIYGIHDPGVENEQSLLATAKKYELNRQNMVTVEPSAFQGLSRDFKGIPEALIFDKKGNYIEYKRTDKDCNAGIFGFIPSLDKNGHYKMTGSAMLSNEIGKLRDLRGYQLATTFIDPNADFYVLISWAVFAGRLNKDHVKVWEGLAANNRKAKIQVIEVNLDVQQWWPKPARDSILQTFYAKK